QTALFRGAERGLAQRGAPLTADAKAWADDLVGTLLASKLEDEVRQGAELAGDVRLASAEKALLQLATRAKLGDAARQAVLTALAGLDARKHAGVLGKVLTDAGAPFAVRAHAAEQLARANLAETRAELLAALPSAPARLQNSIAASMAGSRDGGEALLTAI